MSNFADEESIHDLLIQGIAAARAHGAEEARFYLEWALRSNPAPDQEAEAAYWLSTVASHQAERRDLLEQVLAAQPGHAQARYDLAVLDGRVAPDAVDPTRPVAPFTPTGAVAPGAVRRYPCPTCGSTLVFDPAARSLVCQFCGYRPPAGGPGPEPDEQDWVAAMHSPRGHRWEVPTARSLTCRGCGATWTIPQLRVSETCPFCGAPHVVEAPEERALIAPEGVVLFAVEAAAALTAAQAWLHGGRAGAGPAATVVPPRPIYLPFWTFDVAGSARPIHAPVAPAPGVPAEAAAPERYPIAWDDLLVPASTSLPAALLEALRYDTRTPVPYAPDLLAAWPAEIYRVPLAEASLRAHERALRYLQGLAANDDGLRGLDPNAIFILSYKLVLLPVWVTEYQVEATRYPIVVNGQSGAVAGARPRNRWQRAWDRLAPSEP